MNSHRLTAEQIRTAIDAGPAHRQHPGGVVPVSVEAMAHRRKTLAAPTFATLADVTRWAHWGDVRGVDLRGVVSIPSTRWAANRAGTTPRTMRRHLDALDAAGFVQWVRRPSRTRPGVLVVTDYPETRATRAKRAAARLDATHRPATTSANGRGSSPRRGSASVDTPTGYREGGQTCPPSDSVAYKERARRIPEGETKKNHSDNGTQSVLPSSDRTRPRKAAKVGPKHASGSPIANAWRSASSNREGRCDAPPWERSGLPRRRSEFQRSGCGSRASLTDNPNKRRPA